MSNTTGNRLARASLIALGASLFALSAAAAQQSDYEPPRTPDGKPDLQGIWTNASLTTLQRSRQFDGLVIPDEVAEEAEAQRLAFSEAALEPTDPNAPPPRAGAGVGGYNSFWTDPGTQYGRIDGTYRSSWLVEPEDGQLPYSEEGREIYQSDLSFTRETFTDPEPRALGERCMVGFGSVGGPPMINVLYNNHYQIVQRPDAVMILVEMNHDARIIRIDDEHHPESMRRWMGDSIGWWDGDTLVVETVNMHPDESLRTNMSQSFYISEDATITERFTRVADDQILYEFEVDDPAIYTQTWRAEMALNTAEGPIYEYACHEGNHALPGILAGARREERADAAGGEE
jgi:hypothetical protein